MTRSEAESLIARTDGRLCVRFYRRRDGSIITRDCPVGLRAIRRRVSYVAKAIGSMVLGLFAGLGVHGSFAGNPSFSEVRTMGIMAQSADFAVPIAGQAIDEGSRVAMGAMPPLYRHASHKSRRRNR
jgi:hypothetical protein